MPTSMPVFSSHIQLVNRRLHYTVAGDGPVTILFEAGMGKSRSTWSLVQPEVAKFARAIVYDRAGLGLSNPNPDGSDFGRLLEDHLTVLDHICWSTPVISVGHSYGGPLVRSAALMRPNMVEGVVLVDEVPETLKPEKMMAAMAGASVMYGAQVRLARWKMLRPFLKRSFYRNLEGENLRTALDESTVSAMRAAQAEWQAFEDSFTMLHNTGPHVPQIPLTTITSNRFMDDEARETKDFLGLAQREIAEMSPAGRQVYAKGRGHYVQFTEPELVIREIRKMVDRIS